jgi:hypothetical protein
VGWLLLALLPLVVVGVVGCKKPTAGMPCTKKGEIVCSSGTEALMCVGQAYVSAACDGPKGCYQRTKRTMGCDWIVRAGAPCSTDGDWCSDTGQEWLQCKGNKMETVAICRGPLGCAPLEDTIACDTSLGHVNDPCLGTAQTCSADKRSILVCSSGHLGVERTCEAEHACDPASVRCKYAAEVRH